jgi:hypothetical protein
MEVIQRGEALLMLPPGMTHRLFKGGKALGDGGEKEFANISWHIFKTIIIELSLFY